MVRAITADIRTDPGLGYPWPPPWICCGPSQRQAAARPARTDADGKEEDGEVPRDIANRGQDEPHNAAAAVPGGGGRRIGGWYASPVWGGRANSVLLRGGQQQHIGEDCRALRSIDRGRGWIGRPRRSIRALPQSERVRKVCQGVGGRRKKVLTD